MTHKCIASMPVRSYLIVRLCSWFAKIRASSHALHIVCRSKIVRSLEEVFEGEFHFWNTFGYPKELDLAPEDLTKRLSLPIAPRMTDIGHIAYLSHVSAASHPRGSSGHATGAYRPRWATFSGGLSCIGRACKGQ